MNQRAYQLHLSIVSLFFIVSCTHISKLSVNEKITAEITLDSIGQIKYFASGPQIFAFSDGERIVLYQINSHKISVLKSKNNHRIKHLKFSYFGHLIAEYQNCDSIQVFDMSGKNQKMLNNLNNESYIKEHPIYADALAFGKDHVDWSIRTIESSGCTSYFNYFVGSDSAVYAMNNLIIVKVYSNNTFYLGRRAIWAQSQLPGFSTYLKNKGNLFLFYNKMNSLIVYRLDNDSIIRQCNINPNYHMEDGLNTLASCYNNGPVYFIRQLVSASGSIDIKIISYAF